MNALREAAFEFVALRGVSGTAFDDDWPITPGAVRRAADGCADLLHFAPGRWLVVSPDAELRARLDAYVAASAGVLVDVAGKWRTVAFSVADGARTLAKGIAVDVVLQGRGCAALSLFDCPAVLARNNATFDLYVQSSYAMSAITRSLRTKSAPAPPP